MLRTLEHRGRGPAPVATDGLTCLPLWDEGGPPLPRGLRGILLEDTVPPCPREPAGHRSRLQVVVPAIGEIWLGLDQLLVDQILPVGGDLLGLRVIDGDFPGLAVDVEWTPACLPLQPSEPGPALGWEVGDVIIGIGGM